MIKVDIKAMRPGLEVIGRKVQDIARGGFDGGDDAPFKIAHPVSLRPVFPRGKTWLDHHFLGRR